MKTRHKRIALIIGGLAVLGLVVALVLNAFQSNLVFFFSPTQVAAGEAPKGKSFRIGGLVKEGTIKREADGVTLRFVMTDTERDMIVAYKGILPDLFKEGKGAVAQGKLGEDGVFVASEVLAKHDENYMPPEATKALGDAQQRAAANKAAVEATAKTVKQ
ncbi:MAG: cytochrome c maturation protein CcmE [Propionivibrio sp.]|uniref:cytochrome c maturation protein CcmE n=1 Tax=Propionivibrio sp. TaxID=2212460 RepID=UPI001A532BD6|nr:cytochrome c maturation protein CcmE [Propionivibrio sp.]MBL8413712.1 cytochrome c maturation protein CcmE [Propionivibrio sp.]